MIHPSAIIDPKAELAADVEIGAGTVIGPHVVVRGPTRIGKGNRIFQFASVGEECQDKKYKGEPTRLEIGDNNIIREGATLHRGTVQDNSLTRVRSNTLFMAYVHIAHDCIVGDNCIFANNASIAGHVHVGDGVILGGFTGVHQFCKVGSYAMTSLYSVVNMDIPAFVMVQGYPARARGMNFEGMKRRGYSTELISQLRAAYRTLYRSGMTLAEALARLQDEAGDSAEMAMLLDSLQRSERGIVRE